MNASITHQKLIAHPLEIELGIEPGTTVVEYKEHIPAEIIQPPSYDEKDLEIEEKLEEIYTEAMGQVSTLGDEIERVEGKYKARIGEVSATMLNVALGAVREKSHLKQHKDKVVPAGPVGGSHTVNNNLIVADRNELLRLMIDKAAMANKS